MTWSTISTENGLADCCQWEKWQEIWAGDTSSRTLKTMVKDTVFIISTLWSHGSTEKRRGTWLIYLSKGLLYCMKNRVFYQVMILNLNWVVSKWYPCLLEIYQVHWYLQPSSHLITGNIEGLVVTMRAWLIPIQFSSPSWACELSTLPRTLAVKWVHVMSSS